MAIVRRHVAQIIFGMHLKGYVIAALLKSQAVKHVYGTKMLPQALKLFAHSAQQDFT
jgi:hypothetical protein